MKENADIYCETRDEQEESLSGRMSWEAVK